MEQEQPRRKKETPKVRLSEESQESGVQAGRKKWPPLSQGGPRQKWVCCFSQRKGRYRHWWFGEGVKAGMKTPLLRSVMIPRGFPPKMEEAWSCSRNSCSKTWGTIYPHDQEWSCWGWRNSWLRTFYCRAEFVVGHAFLPGALEELRLKVRKQANWRTVMSL